MEPDQARYHCLILHAIADLLEAGEPVEFATFSEARAGDPATVRITLDGQHLRASEAAVRQRVGTGDEQYIRVEHREPTRGPNFSRRRR